MKMIEKDKTVNYLIKDIISLISKYNETAKFRGYEIYGILDLVKQTYILNMTGGKNEPK